MLWFLTLVISSAISVSTTRRTFSIDYTKNTFDKDQKSFRYVSGSMHYSRVPFYYWKDRLDKFHAAGFDAVQTYIPWNVHEPLPGVYDFSGQQDIVQFINQAQASGLLVILRAGPYICGEWEFGGFPPWILAKNGSIVLRTMDPGFIFPVDRWFSVLLPKIKPLLYENGGPVIMVQVENEYGSYPACDQCYTSHLRDTFTKYLGNNILLFTTDGNSLHFLKCGAIPGTYTTVDFGPGGNVSRNFEPMIEWNENKGPLVNSEFYTGWLDYWGQKHAHTDTTDVCNSLDSILKLGGNVNMYMFEGGTSFGYMNGADPPFNICPTSYDYDAPLTEAGDITPKYLAIRSVINKYKKLPDVPVPPSTKKFAYGEVPMQLLGTVLELLNVLSPKGPIQSTYPLSMEQVGQNYGFILYRTTLPKLSHTKGISLQVPGLRDRAQVLIDGHPVGRIDRKGATEIDLNFAFGNTLDIVVENQGRINFGENIMFNRKGIISNVTLNSTIILTSWEIYPLNLTRVFETDIRPSANVKPAQNLPCVFLGKFVIPDTPGKADTFLNVGGGSTYQNNTPGWSKGQAFINGFNLGRYWPDKGPQITLYVPYGVLKPHPRVNKVLLFEVDYDKYPCQHAGGCNVKFVDTAIINGTVHNNSGY